MDPLILILLFIAAAVALNTYINYRRTSALGDAATRINDYLVRFTS